MLDNYRPGVLSVVYCEIQAPVQTLKKGDRSAGFIHRVQCCRRFIVFYGDQKLTCVCAVSDCIGWEYGVFGGNKCIGRGEGFKKKLGGRCNCGCRDSCYDVLRRECI